MPLAGAERARVARRPKPLGVAPGAAPRRDDGQAEAPARGARGHAHRAARTVLLVARSLVRDEHVHPPLHGERPCAVAHARRGLERAAGLGVAPVVAQPHLGAGGERPTARALDDPLALHHEALARGAAIGRVELVGAVALGADPHRVGPDVEHKPARARAVEQPAPEPHRAQAHLGVGRRRPLDTARRQLPGAPPGQHPRGHPRIEVEARVGVDALERALQDLAPERHVALALREHHARERALPPRIEPEDGGGHVAVDDDAPLLGLEPAGRDPPPGAHGRTCTGLRLAVREMEGARAQEVAGADGARIGLALRLPRPRRKPEGVVVPGRRYRPRGSGEVDAADGDVRAAPAFEALRQRIDHLASHHASETHERAVRCRPRRLDRLDRLTGGAVDSEQQRPSIGDRRPGAASAPDKRRVRDRPSLGRGLGVGGCGRRIHLLVVFQHDEVVRARLQRRRLGGGEDRRIAGKRAVFACPCGTTPSRNFRRIRQLGDHRVRMPRAVGRPDTGRQVADVRGRDSRNEGNLDRAQGVVDGAGAGPEALGARLFVVNFETDFRRQLVEVRDQHVRPGRAAGEGAGREDDGKESSHRDGRGAAPSAANRPEEPVPPGRGALVRPRGRAPRRFAPPGPGVVGMPMRFTTVRRLEHPSPLGRQTALTVIHVHFSSGPTGRFPRRSPHEPPVAVDWYMVPRYELYAPQFSPATCRRRGVRWAGSTWSREVVPHVTRPARRPEAPAGHRGEREGGRRGDAGRAAGTVNASSNAACPTRRRAHPGAVPSPNLRRAESACTPGRRRLGIRASARPGPPIRPRRCTRPASGRP